MWHKMKRLSLLTGVLLAGAALFFYQNQYQESNQTQIVALEATQTDVKLSKKDRVDLAMQQEFDATKDPALGYVPRERLYQAYRYAEAQRAAGFTADKRISPDWTERGPDNFGGRTRAILIDPNDGTNKSVFAAGVAGGLWKTTDITATNPNWVSVNDFFENMAITTLAYDPAVTNTLYFGTGEGWFNVDAVTGDGIFKSTDGGANWTQLGSTTSSTFDYVQKIVVHPSSGDVFAATRTTGVQRSTDDGASWSTVLASGTGAGTSRAADLEIGADGTIYAAMGIFSTDGVYSSATGASGSWTKLNTGTNGFPTSGFERIEVACAPANANVLYAITHNNTDDGVGAIYRSANKGSTWTTVSNPVDDDTGIGGDFTRNQAWYDLIAAVSPTDASGDTLLAGGIDLFKSTDGGSNWTQISHWTGGFGYQYVHADQHAIVYQPDNPAIIYFGNDGGIYRSSNGNATTPTISERNSGYNVTQFYSCAIHPTSGTTHFLAGAQDNGSHKFNSAGVNSTTEVTGGDGAFCHIDQDEPSYQFTQYVFNSFFRSTDGGNSFGSRITVSLSLGFFINPSDYDDNSNVYYSSYASGSYLRWTNPQTGLSFSSVGITAFNGVRASAITVSPNTANRVFFGTEGGRVVRVDNANGTATATHINSGAGMPSGTISCIAVEDGDDLHLLVTYSNYGVSSIWETVDGGSNWLESEGDLPDMPVRWALFSPANSDQALIATELGVWSTDNLNSTSTTWTASNTGLANVRTDMLQIRSSDNVVIAATHGRGLYSTDVFSDPAAAFEADKTVAYIGNTITFTDASLAATSWSWNFGDGSTSTSQNPAHVYATAGKYSVTLSINGGVDTEVKSDYIHILPNRGTPYEVTDGGDFESNANDFGSMATAGTVDLWERGTPSNAITTLNSSSNGWKTDLDADIQQADYTTSLFSPSFNLSSAGTYTLRFRKSMEVVFGNAPIGVWVDYSTDQGDNWTRLGTDSDGLGTNWYNRGPATTSSDVTPDGYAFSSNYTNQNTEYNISALAGNDEVCFRINLICETGWTVSGYLADGFMVDDFEILGEINDPVLPVELQAFTAIPNSAEQAIELNWRTQSEVNNSHWLIERSDDGSQFRTIARLDGQGTTPAATDYAYRDQAVSRGSSYRYRLADVSFSGEVYYHPVLSVTLGDGDDPDGITTFELQQNFPNPFNPSTTIAWQLPQTERVTLRIYDITGRLVRVLVDESQDAGVFQMVWDGADDSAQHVASGLYVYRLQAGGFVDSRKMLLVR